MNTQRKLKWCEACKTNTMHEIKGKLKACTKCHLRTEVIWQRGRQTENELEDRNQ